MAIAVKIFNFFVAQSTIYMIAYSAFFSHVYVSRAREQEREIGRERERERERGECEENLWTTGVRVLSSRSIHFTHKSHQYRLQCHSISHNTLRAYRDVVNYVPQQYNSVVYGCCCIPKQGYYSET